MNHKFLPNKLTGLLTSALLMASITVTKAQSTNVFDDVIATSSNHTSLKAALEQEGLDVMLRDSTASYTVFAPDNDAFDKLAAALNTNIAGLLMLPNLSDVLQYHVLGSAVASSAITNGDIVSPLNNANTIKLTKTSGGMVYANHAMVNAADLSTDNGVVHSIDEVILPSETVVDVAIDNGFSTLATAVITAELLPVLTDPFGTFTVFAPTNDAFDSLAANLNTDINGLLQLPNLSDVLTYHVLGAELPSANISNGAVSPTVSTTNTLKLTKTTSGDVFVNQAQVIIADVNSDNGIVHAIDAVVLPSETVVDVAIDNGFTYLSAAVSRAELRPVLTDPFASFTVFAPTNDAFDSLAVALNTDIDGLLALPNLADILTYHVLGAEVLAGDINNGDIVAPLSTSNTLKLTKTSMGDVFVNQAQVTMADVMADNGSVHVLNEVVLPSETVVDVAIDNGFSTLATAVITVELLPALSDPFEEYTVFAPTNDAFLDLAAELNTDLNGILELPTLSEILLYHVVSGTVLSSELTAGPVNTLNGNAVQIDLSNGVMVNMSTVTTADVTADNGVVHVIDGVLDPTPLSVNDPQPILFNVFPNPAVDVINVQNMTNAQFEMFDTKGVLVKMGSALNSTIDISNLETGVYFLNLKSGDQTFQSRIVKQ